MSKPSPFAVKLLGFPTTLGLPHRAVRHGPEALRAAGLVPHLAKLGTSVTDLGDLPLREGLVADPVSVRLAKTVDAARHQANHWLTHHRPGSLMMTLGGDHSTSLGTIWALSQLGQPFDVVWIDAHGDFNIRETSPTGNTHGMVLSLAAGLMPDDAPKMVSPAQLKLWGVRDLDPGERLLLQRERVEVLSPDQTRVDPAALVRSLQPNVFLSFDIDSVDPAEAPGTMVPVSGGYRVQEALELVSLISRHRNLVAVDIVEFHPDYDRRDRTANLALAVARTAVAGQIAYATAKAEGSAVNY